MDAWILILFVGGLALIVMEIITPGVILGVIGLGCVVAAIAMAFQRAAGPQMGVALLASAAVLLPIFLVVWTKVFDKYLALRKTEADVVSADAGLKTLVGQEGVALTMLRPAGTALVGDRRVDVVTLGELIEKDTRIAVIKVEGSRVVVRSAHA